MATPTRSGPKRARPSSGDLDYGSMPDSNVPSGKKQRLRGALSLQGFACHFYKRNPSKHFACLGFHCSKLKDEHQHLKRAHWQSALYCPICKEEFSTQADSDAHIREQSCVSNSSNIQGVTPIQAQQISKIMRTREPDDYRWFQMWDVLFPGCERPTSVYRTDLATEVMSDFRNHYRHVDQHALIDRNLRRLCLNPSEAPALCEVIDSIVEAYQAYTQEQRPILENSAAQDQFGIRNSTVTLSGTTLRSTQYVDPAQLQRQEPSLVPLLSSDATHDATHNATREWAMKSSASYLVENTDIAYSNPVNFDLLQHDSEFDLDQYIQSNDGKNDDDDDDYKVDN